MKKLLSYKNLTITVGPIPEKLQADAWAKWPDFPTKVRVQVDPRRCGIVRAVVHELLHVLLDDSLWAFDPGLEEIMIRAFEDALYEDLVNNGEVAAWAKLIEARTTPLGD